MKGKKFTKLFIDYIIKGKKFTKLFIDYINV